MVAKSEDWRQLVIDHLNNVQHSDDEASVSRMVARARSYILVDGILYKKGIVQPLRKCITQGEGKEKAQFNHSANI